MFGIGISILSPGPVKEAYIELGDVTVLIGPNDSGKTRILRLIESALTAPFNGGGEELIEVVGLATQDEQNAFIASDWPDDQEIREEVEALKPLAAALDYGLPDQYTPIGVRVPFGWLRRLPAWRCGRSAAELSDDLRARLRGARAGDFDHHEPAKIAYLGGAAESILPTALAVPAPPEAVEAEAQQAVIQLCISLRALGANWPMAADVVGELEGGPDPDWAPMGEIEDVGHDASGFSPLWLLAEDGASTIVHPAALRACDAFERLVARLVPDFIGSIYRLEVQPNSPTQIARGNPVNLQLVRRAASIEWADELHFSIRNTASGFVVWLQLAIREASARIENLAQILLSGGDDARSNALKVLHETPNADDAQAELGGIKQMLEEALASLDDPNPYPADSEIVAGLRPVPTGTVDPNSGGAVEGWSIFRPRLYLIDEPEQRLHPSLQRQAAQWLVELMGVWQSRCIVATHSFAFMDLPGRVNAYEIVHSGGQAMLKPFDLAEFTPRAHLARALGLDRGELLSRWRAFLFVEGLADVAVIEELFVDELNENHIRVLPVHGHRHHAGLLDMSVLADEVSTPIAALFDGISDDEVGRLRRASASELRRAMKDPSEKGTVAQVIDLANRRERDIGIFTIAVPDIFYLLDEQTIRDASKPATPSRAFPGHNLARKKFGTRVGPRNAAAYKQFLFDTYGVSTAAGALRRVASQMRDGNTPRPPQLENVIHEVERLALIAEART